MSKNAYFYLGLALVTAAVLMFQIVETRILSVISWYYLSFFVISMAMFGLTAGAVWVYLKAGQFSGVALAYNLSRFGGLFALTSIASIFVQLNLPLVIVPADNPLLILLAGAIWAVLVVSIAVPFFYAGIVVSLALTRSPFPIGRVYGVDLIGAAAGCLGAPFLLTLTDGPSAMLWVAALSALGAGLFKMSRVGSEQVNAPPTPILTRRPHLIAGAAAILALLNGVTDLGIDPNYIKGRSVSADPEPAYQEWNSFSHVAQYKVQTSVPRMWGPSPRFIGRDWSIAQRKLVIDGDAGTTSYGIEGDVQKAAFLAYDVTNLAYFMPDRRSAAVIGVGGGRDMLAARLFGIDRVVGVELNPIIMRLLVEEPESAAFAGVAGLAGMQFHVDEARSWFARSKDRFDVVQMSLIDTWAATGAGAYTLSENGLYTTEAWRIFLNHLTERGVFTVSRWYGPGEVNETGRMLSLATAVLLERGADNPQRHLFVVAADRIATLIVSREPMSRVDIGALVQAAETMEFRILVRPDRPPATATLAAIVQSPSYASLIESTSRLKLDLTPPTDERPFFFNQLPLYNLDKFFRETLPGLGDGVARGNLRATLTLVTLVVLSLVLVAATIVVPLRPAVTDVGRRLALGGTAYFFLIGAGFMFFEIALLQRMSIFLGQPIYSLSIVLFSMILSTGLGSLLSDRIVLDTWPRLVTWAAVTATYVFSFNVWLPDLLLAAESAPLVVRGGLVVSVIAPAGLLLGFGFPTGMRLITAVDPRPTPWFWGINGAAGVLASSLAVLCSMAYGIGASVLFAALCYLMLIPAMWVIGVVRGNAPRTLAGSQIRT